MASYRENASVERAPIEEVAWRRSVGKGVASLFFFAICLVLALQFGEPHQAWALFYFAITPSAWMMTSPRPGRRRDWLAWAYLASVVACVILSGMALAGLVGLVAIEAVGVVPLGAAVAIQTRLWMRAGDGGPRDARVARVLIVFAALTVVAGLLDQFIGSLAVRILAIVCAVGVLRSALQIGSRLRVNRHEWWRDDGAAAPEEWVSLVVYVDGHAELISVAGRLRLFESKDTAWEWLYAHGYVWGTDLVPDATTRK